MRCLVLWPLMFLPVLVVDALLLFFICFVLLLLFPKRKPPPAQSHPLTADKLDAFFGQFEAPGKHVGLATKKVTTKAGAELYLTALRVNRPAIEKEATRPFFSLFRWLLLVLGAACILAGLLL